MARNKSSSGVSIAIRNTNHSLTRDLPLVEKSNPSEFTLKVANNLKEREAVYRLGYQVYLEKGYVKENASQWLVREYDKSEDTVILMVKDRNNVLAGSVSIVFRESTPMPIEKIYKEEVEKIASADKKIVEIARLIIDPNFRNSKEVLILLINHLFIYTYHVKEIDYLTIQVNPRHKDYYKKLLKFEELGEVKECPSARNAPGAFLYLPLSTYRKELYTCHSNVLNHKKDRSLYQHFLKPELENLVAEYLNRQVIPISQMEKEYFGFSETTFGRAVCV